MSSQRQLADYDTVDDAVDEDDETPPRPEFHDNGETRCEHCNAHVSQQFVRVFGSNDGRLHCCQDCASMRELQDGHGAEPGYDPDEVGR